MHESGTGPNEAETFAGEDLRELVATAHKEWQAAQDFFQLVCAPDLVDEAISAVEAAQKKYMHLLSLVRQGPSD